MKRKIIKNIFFLVTFYFLLSTFLCGCVTIAPKETLPTFNINGATYFSLASICNQRDISLEYDTISRRVLLHKDNNRINLMIGAKLIRVNGAPEYLSKPVDIYQGRIVVPYKFKKDIIERLFKLKQPKSEFILSKSRIKKIVIDAGHGGKDPGAIGRTGLQEKEVNLDIARNLRKLLLKEGIKVVMTRDNDEFIPLCERVRIANNSAADLFVSIHANANRVRSLDGFEIYYVSPEVNDSDRAYTTVKSAILNLGSSSLSEQSHNLKAILWDMIYTSFRAESIDLSHCICQATKRNLDARIIGVKAAKFEVLRGARMPAVLVEVGFLSNFDEEQKLKNSYYRKEMAESIAEGIKDYARQIMVAQAYER